MITEREISIAKEIANQLRHTAEKQHSVNTGWSLKKRRELEEKAGIIEKLDSIAIEHAQLQEDL